MYNETHAFKHCLCAHYMLFYFSFPIESKGVLEKFTNLTEKHLCCSLLLALGLQLY